MQNKISLRRWLYVTNKSVLSRAVVYSQFIWLRTKRYQVILAACHTFLYTAVHML